MSREQLEFSINQYLDGTLEEAERVALEARLANDPEAQEVLREERALTAVLRSGPKPAVKWEALADRISGAIDEEMDERVGRASWVLRMRSPWVLAAAASVAVVVGMGLRILTMRQGGTTGTQGTVIARSLDVEGPQEDRPAGPVVTEVSIGPGGTYAKASSLAPYADEIDARPTRVVIAAGTPVVPEEVPAASPF